MQLVNQEMRWHKTNCKKHEILYAIESFSKETNLEAN